MKCKWYQFWINRSLDGDQPLSEGARDHVRSCARCEQFHREQTSLSRRLNEKVEPEVQPSPFLKQRILNEIAREALDSAERGNLQWIGAGAVAAVALAFAILLSGNGRQESVARSAGGSARSEWLALTAKMPTGDSLFRVVTNLDQPLHQELDFVIQDARAVLDSLTEEFVPSRLLASNH